MLIVAKEVVLAKILILLPSFLPLIFRRTSQGLDTHFAVFLKFEL